MATFLRRRDFVFSTAAGALFFSPLLRLRRAIAQGTPPPQRFIGLVITGGIPQKQFWQSGGTGALVLPNCLKALDKHRSRMLLVKGMNTVPTREHGLGVSCALTGTSVKNYGTEKNPDPRAAGASIDTLIRQKLGDTGKYLNVATNAGKADGSRTVSYVGSGKIATAFNQPVAAFNHVFSGATAPPPPPPVSTTTDRSGERRVQKLLYGHIREDALRLQRELGGSDRQRLQDHLDGVNALEQRILGKLQDEVTQTEAQPKVACSPPTVANHGKKYNLDLQDYFDLFVEAIRCNHARTFTLLFSYGASHYMEWVNGMVGNNTGSYHLNCQHAYSGAAPGNSGKSAITKNYELAVGWHAQELARLATALEGIKEADGSTALDNTVVYWTSDIAGNTNGTKGVHTHANMPAILLSGSPRMKMGRFINLGGANAENQNKVLTTIAGGLGANIKGFGAHPNCGPLPGVLV